MYSYAASEYYRATLAQVEEAADSDFDEEPMSENERSRLINKGQYPRNSTVQRDENTNEDQTKAKNGRLVNFWNDPQIICGLIQYLLNEGEMKFMPSRADAFRAFQSFPIVREKARGCSIPETMFKRTFTTLVNGAEKLAELSTSLAAHNSTATAAQNHLDPRSIQLQNNIADLYASLLGDKVKETDKINLRALGEKLKAIKTGKSILDRKNELRQETLLALEEAMEAHANSLGGAVPKTKAAAATSEKNNQKVEIAREQIRKKMEDKARTQGTNMLRNIDVVQLSADAKRRAEEKLHSMESMQRELMHMALRQQQQLDEIKLSIANSMHATPPSIVQSRVRSAQRETPFGFPSPNSQEQHYSAVKRPCFDVEDVEDVETNSPRSIQSSSSEMLKGRSPAIKSSSKRHSRRGTFQDDSKSTLHSPQQLTIIKNRIIGNPIIGSTGNSGYDNPNIRNPVIGSMGQSGGNSQVTHYEGSQSSRSSSVQANSDASLVGLLEQAVKSGNMDEVARVVTMMKKKE